MTTTEPEAAPATPGAAEPEGDEAGESVRLVRTGWVRCLIGGQTVRLRPPFFGEFKRLRLAFEEVQDTLTEASEDLEIVAQRLVDQARALHEDTKMDAGEKVRAQRALRRESSVAGRGMNEQREALMVDWWAEVFRALCVDLGNVDWLEDPDRMPTWLTAPTLPTTLIQHWRAAPLARG